MHLGQATSSLEHPARDTFPVLVEQLTRVYEHAPAHQQVATERQLTELILGGSHITHSQSCSSYKLVKEGQKALKIEILHQHSVTLRDLS